MKKLDIKTVFFFLSLILLVSCSSNDDEQEQEQEQVQEQEEEKEATLEGNYLGTWNSSTDQNIVFTDFGVSAKFEFANAAQTRLNGEFFATTAFSSCCNSGDNDGSMILDLDGNDIISFSFNDIITNCTGNFSGTGSITSITPYTIQINFTGNDCDGNHTGQLNFRRLDN